MQGNGEEEYPPWIERALVLVGTIIYLVEYLKGVAVWAICTAAVIDLVAYLRGK